jgi:hypothetical protein
MTSFDNSSILRGGGGVRVTNNPPEILHSEIFWKLFNRSCAASIRTIEIEIEIETNIESL